MELLLEDKGGRKEELTSVTLTMYFLAIVAQMTMFSLGFEMGSTSTAIMLVQNIADMHLTSVWKELVIAGSMPSAVISCLISAWFSDKYGRKKCVMFSCCCYILGAIITSLAYSREVLLIGRILTGSGIGFINSNVYVAECSPRHLRGFLVGLDQPIGTIGTVLASVVSTAFCDDKHNGWRFIWGLQGVFALAQFLGLLFLPESPRWLIQKSRRKEAEESLTRLRNSEYIEEELREIEQSFKVQSFHISGGGNLVLRMLKTKSVRRALMVGCGVHFFARISGVNAIVYYSGVIIQMSGVGNVTTAIWNTVIINCITFVFAIVGLWLIDRLGRRILAIIGFFGLFLGSFGLGTTFLMLAKYSPSVNATEGVLTSTCSIYRQCDDCIRDAACGFCHEDVPDVINGACLLVNDTSHLTSEVGACNSSLTLSKYSMKWVYDHCPVSFSWVTIIGLTFYVVFCGISMGHLPWTINAEIHPLWARSMSNGIATMVSMMSNFVTIATFLSFIEVIHHYGVFYVMGSVALMGSVFCFFFLPETKNKSLEEIEALFLPDKQSI